VEGESITKKYCINKRGRIRKDVNSNKLNINVLGTLTKFTVKIY